MMPPRPARLSTIHGEPSAGAMRFAMSRATMSLMPPAGYGTTRRTGFAG
jgi:hypothetical protein